MTHGSEEEDYPTRNIQLRRLLLLVLISCAGHILQTSGQSQGGCPPNCGTCYENLTCKTCQPHSTLYNGTCQACGSNCIFCTHGTNCTECEEGYGPIFNTVDCGICSQTPECAGGCAKNGAGKCDVCKPGFRLEGDNTVCQPCISNCRACQTNVTYCDACFAGYGTYPGNRTCGPCSAYCTVKNTCYMYGAATCDKCDPGYYWTPEKSCGPCASNCLVCNVSLSYKCDICQPGYGLTADKTCAPCLPNCAAGCNITGAYKCNRCDPGYGLTASGSCDKCSPNCAAGCIITGAYKCDRCDPGYGLTANSSCDRGPTTNSFNSTAQPSQTQRYISDWTPDAATWITLVETTSSKRIIGGNMTCPVLEIGLGIGVPCGFIILVLVIIVIVLCIKNRKYKREIQDQQRRQKKMQSHTLASSETVQPSSLQYQQLQKQNLDREYQGIDQYDSISTAANTGYYETPLN